MTVRDQFKKIQKITILFFLITLVINSFVLLITTDENVPSLIVNPNIYVVFFPLILFLTNSFLQKMRIIRYRLLYIFQITTFFLCGVLMVIGNKPGNITGLIIIAVAWALSGRYTLFFRHRTLFSLIVFILTTFLVFISLIIHRSKMMNDLYFYTNAFKFLLLLFFLGALIYYAFVHQLVYLTGRLNLRGSRYADLKRQETILRERKRQIEKAMNNLRKKMTPVDPAQFRLSELESKVVEFSIRYRNLSSHKVAKKLEISAVAFRSHIYRLCNKTGMSNRAELNELFLFHYEDFDE